jgi:acyl carrier protein
MMTFDEVLTVIAEEAAAIRLGALTADEVTAEHRLWAGDRSPSLDLDSLDIFELVYRVESRTGLEFADLDLMGANTVGELVGRITGQT